MSLSLLSGRNISCTMLNASKKETDLDVCVCTLIKHILSTYLQEYRIYFLLDAYSVKYGTVYVMLLKQ